RQIAGHDAVGIRRIAPNFGEMRLAAAARAIEGHGALRAIRPAFDELDGLFVTGRRDEILAPERGANPEWKNQLSGHLRLGCGPPLRPASTSPRRRDRQSPTPGQVRRRYRRQPAKPAAAEIRKRA